MLLVHGPGGIGKSTLLETFAGVASAEGWSTHAWQAAELIEHEVHIGHLGELAASADRRLLLVDGCDRVPALMRQLRMRVGKRLAPGSRLVVASREPPEVTWHVQGWDAQAQALRVDALDEHDAAELLCRRGVVDSAHRATVVRWSAGHPLALALAADLLRDDPEAIHRLDVTPDLGGALVRHLLGGTASGQQHLTLAAVAFAGEIDEAALAAALPDHDARGLETWLRGLSFVHAHGSRLRVHDSVREILASAFLAADPERSVLIRRNLADHHLRRGLARDPAALADLAALLRDRQVRTSLVGGEGREAQATGATPEDVPELMRLVGGTTEGQGSLARWFEEAPEHVAVTRDQRGDLLGWVIACSVANHPVWVVEDPVVGPWLREAAASYPDSFFVRALVDRTWLAEPEAVVPPVISAGQAWFARRLGIATERYCFAAASPELHGPVMPAAWLHRNGHRRYPGLDVRADGLNVETWFVDHGPGGLIAAAWRTVYAELGLAPPEGLPVVDVEAAVRDALRNCQDEAALAVNPLARGTTIHERAAYVRRALASATDRALSSGGHDKSLRRLVELTYLGDDQPIRLTLRELAISRATYYRWLDEATRRIARVID